MNKSFFAGLFLKIYKCLLNSYENSFFKKLCDKSIDFLKKITRNSFFVNFFSAPFEKSYAENSGLFKFIGKILGFFKKILLLFAKPIKNSSVINFFKSFYSDLLNFSLRYVGVFLICVVALYTVMCALVGSVTPLMYMVSATGVLAGLVCYILNTSVYNLFTSSIAVRGLAKIFDKCQFEQHDTIPTTKSGVLICVLLGFGSAVASFFAGPLYTVIFLAGCLFIGWILYDFGVGIFIVAVMLPFLPTMVLAGLIIFTFVSFVLRLVFNEDMKFKRTPLDVPLLAFLGVLIVSAFTSFAVKSSVMAVMVYTVFIMSYYLLTNSVKTKERLCSLLVLMLFAGLLVALYGIYQYVFGFAEGTTWIDEDMFSDIETRVVSTFENPNVLGEYLLLLIPIGIAVVWGTKKGYNKLIHFAIVGALSLCMIYTYSRGNWIGLIVAVFMFFMFYDRRFVWLGVVALLLSPMFLPQNVINRFLSVGDMGDSSTSYRVYIWMGTLNMLKDYWFSGIGIGTEAFNEIYPLYSYSGVTAPHSHNLYLQILTENGVAGIIVFVWMMVMYFKMCISTIVKCDSKLLKGLTTGCSAGMLGYLVQGMFDNVWYNYRVFLLFFVILAITVCCAEITKSYSEEMGQ